MAIYFPELFCEIGDELILKKDIVFDDVTLSKDLIYTVENIIGYGIDLKGPLGEEFRIMNSQMDNYFYTPDVTKAIISEIISETLGGEIEKPDIIKKIAKDLGGKHKSKKQANTSYFEVVMFTRKFEIKNVITIETGTRFFFEIDEGFFNLFDVNNHRKVLRLNQKEMNEYCEVENALVEELTI